ncbi:methylmalonyl Co-A mutase-associated GTPase MeaB [[Eubacterium] cellulosolvens]
MHKSREISEMVDKLLSGDRKAAAKLMTIVENEEATAKSITKKLESHIGRAYIIGVTGPLGAGKSTIIDAIVKGYRNRKQKVGVVAVDPSSEFTGGALLGDRIRQTSSIGDKEVFFRSLSTRGCLGGLSRCANDVAKILDAYGSNIILIETTGAGQSDINVARIAQTTILILTPAVGDDIQLMKSGIIEIADIFIINKADLPGSEILEAMLKASPPKNSWDRPVIKTIARKGEGIPKLIDAIEQHRKHIKLKSVKKSKKKTS